MASMQDDPVLKAFDDFEASQATKTPSAVKVEVNSFDDDPVLRAFDDFDQREKKRKTPKKLPEEEIVTLSSGYTVSPAKNRREFGAGVGQSVRDIISSFDKPAMWLDEKLGSPTIGGIFPTAREAADRNLAARGQFETEYGENPNASAGRLVGQGALTAIPLSRMGFGTNLLGRIASGATQGAAGAALVSGGSDAPLEEQLAIGATIGGGIPAVGSALKAGKDFAGRFIEPFTESGRSAIAKRILDEFGGGPISSQSKEIVPGSLPTLAEVSGNPGIARLQDTLRDINSAPFEERLAANAAARKELFSKAAGTPEDIETAVALRADQAESVIKGLFSKERVVNPAPVINQIDEILTGPKGKRDAVKTSLNNIRSKVIDRDGNLETDTETLYESVRKQIGDLLDKSNLTNPAGKQAAKELIQIQDVLDDVIEEGAPGFKAYLSEFSTASKPIDAMEWLQNLKITDSKGNITLSKVTNAIQNAEKLKKTKGVNKAKSLSNEQLSTLRTIRDDLLRQENLTLGKSFGSPTVQKGSAQNKLQSMLPGKEGLFSGKMNPELIGAVLGQSAGSALGIPGIGTAAGGFAGRTIKNAYNAKGQAIRNALEEIMLNPESLNTVIRDNRMAFPKSVKNLAFLRKASPTAGAVSSNYLLNVLTGNAGMP